MKTTYESVSPYWVMDEIRSGNEVYVLDKSTRAVETVNDMTVRRATDLVERAAKHNGNRYEFWYVLTEEEVENG